jgi:hypothetical protein
MAAYREKQSTSATMTIAPNRIRRSPYSRVNGSIPVDPIFVTTGIPSYRMVPQSSQAKNTVRKDTWRLHGNFASKKEITLPLSPIS